MDGKPSYVFTDILHDAPVDFDLEEQRPPMSRFSRGKDLTMKLLPLRDRLPHTLTIILAVALTTLTLATVHGDEPKDQAAARAYNAAAALQNNALHDRAAVKWAEFVKAFPNDERADRASYYLGVCHLRMKKFTEAASSFQTVLSKWPKFKQLDGAQYNLGMALYELAIVSKKKEDYQKAAAAFAVVATKYAKSDFADEALYFQGDCAYAIGDQKGAVDAFQKLIKGYPQSSQLARAFYDLGITQQELGLSKEAAETFKTFLGRQEFTAHELATEIRLRWAICLYEQKQTAEAEKQFEQLANTKDFAFADFALLRLGQSKMDAEKWEEAANVLAQFPKRFAKSPYKNEAAKTAGRCYFQAGKLNEAEAALKPIIGGNDALAAEASYWLGRTQLKKNQPQQALQTLEAASNKFNEGEFVPYIRVARADALYELPERRKETAALYEAFVKEFPKHPLTTQASYMAALAALGAEQFPKARQLAEPLLANADFAKHELYPAVLYIAAEAYLLEDPDNKPNGAKAEQLYRQLVTKFAAHPRAGRSHLRIGWILQSSDKRPEAINYLNSVVAKLDKVEQQPEARLIIARCFATDQKHKEAVAACNAALQANAKWSRADEVLLTAAQSYRGLNDAKTAKDRLNKLISAFAKSPLRAQAVYLLGETAQSEKQHDEAIKSFTQVTQQHADSEFHGLALYGLGAACYAKEDYAASRGWLDKVVAGKDEDLKKRGLYLRGMVQHRMKDFAKGAADLTGFLAAKPDPAEALNARYTLALCRIGQKQFPEASQTLAQLLTDKPDFEHADKVYYELGHALLEQKDKQADAAQTFQTLAEKLPESPLAAESWFRVGQYHSDAAKAEADAKRQEQLAKAQTAFTTGIAKVKEKELREKLQYKLGDTLFQLGKFAEAIATLTAQIQEHPQGTYVGPARYLAGQSHFRLDQFDKALPLFVQVTQDKFPGVDKPQVDEYRSQALYQAGTCAAKLKNWKESETRYAQLISEFAKFDQVNEARYGLARAAQQQNQHDKALAIYEEITRQTETEAAAKSRFMVGEIYFAKKKYEDAIEHFLLVSVGYPYEEWQALARFETARCFVELKDVKRAIQSLREMIDKHPEHPRTKDAQKMLTDLTK